MNRIQQIIEAKLTTLAPSHMEVLNESHMHSVPPDSETHFKVTLVAEVFSGLRQVKRHQQVYSLLSEEMAGPVHALALHLFAPDEWQGERPDSPDCMGGSKG